MLIKILIIIIFLTSPCYAITQLSDSEIDMCYASGTVYVEDLINNLNKIISNRLIFPPQHYVFIINMTQKYSVVIVKDGEIRVCITVHIEGKMIFSLT